MPEFIAISLRIGPLTTVIVANELVLLDLAEMPLDASARMTGKYSGRAPAITALTATFSTVNSQPLAECGRAELADDLVRRMTGPFEHRLDARLRRQHDRQRVRPVVVLEEPMEVVLGVGFDQPRSRTLERQPLQIGLVKRRREALEHPLHERPLGDGILAFDVGAQVRGRTVHDRLRHIRLTETRHAHGQRRCVAEPFEDVRVHGDRGDAVLLQPHGKPDDRRATGASKTDGENRAVTVGRDRLPHLLVVGPRLTSAG